MSLGGLKVAENTEEINLENKGVHILMGDVDDTTCKAAMEWILRENFKQERAKKLTLIVNSYGGYCHSGFALIDIMRGSSIPVHTVGLGAIGSMGFAIFIAGDKGNRLLTPQTSILSHCYSSGAFGTHHDLVADRKEQDLTYERMMNHYLKCIDMSKKDIEKHLLTKNDVWMSAKEAHKLGVCDKVRDL